MQERTLFLNGTIAEESWFDDDVTPQVFKEELTSGSGDITVWINSPGGNVFAAAEIYTMLKDYKGSITVNVDTADMPEGEMLVTVTLTTNSPSRPIVNLFLTGWIE